MTFNDVLLQRPGWQRGLRPTAHSGGCEGVMARAPWFDAGRGEGRRESRMQTGGGTSDGKRQGACV